MRPAHDSTRRAGRRPRLLPAAGVAALLAAAVPAAHGFDINDVIARAQQLAESEYVAPAEEVPEWLRQISYDQWRDIRYRPEEALWRDAKLPFQVQFFHPGLFYDRRVAINVVDGTAVRPVEFSPSLFDYGRNDFASKVPQRLGFAGFRVHAPIKRPQYYDEVIVFLGASYFRAVGRDQVFGLSARALAIDTALPGGEEFPYFREFWLVKPAPKARSFVAYGLLDSPSLTGAYRFTITPGVQTAVAVEARIFFRREVAKLGLAPLTSMFFYGENTPRAVEDFRPEVHDSDGLLLHLDTGEWLWRPLDNPRLLQVTSFRMPHPRGFGLLQRDRNFAHYEDPETRRDLRPSAWVVPGGDWGKGRVELVEIPTKSDTNDNVVAYWVADTPPRAGERVAVSYTVYWHGDDPTRSPNGRVVATRRDRGNKENAYRFVVDFAGKALAALPEKTVLRAVVTVATGPDSAELLDQQVIKKPGSGEWRLTFQIRPKRKEPIELRAFLDKADTTLTETWSYTLLPY